MPKRYSVALVIAAIVYVLVGLVLILWPDQARLILCYAMGAALLLYGAYRIIAYFYSQGPAPVQFGVAVGLGCLILGALLLAKANTLTAVFATLVGAALVAGCILRIQLALDIRRMGGRAWGAMAICALVMLAVGVTLILNPFKVVKTATIIAGAAMLADGLLALWSVLTANSLIKNREAQARVK